MRNGKNIMISCDGCEYEKDCLDAADYGLAYCFKSKCPLCGNKLKEDRIERIWDKYTIKQ